MDTTIDSKTVTQIRVDLAGLVGGYEGRLNALKQERDLILKMLELMEGSAKDWIESAVNRMVWNAEKHHEELNKFQQQIQEVLV